jgi:hypothetical protein
LLRGLSLIENWIIEEKKNKKNKERKKDNKDKMIYVKNK